MRLSLVKRQAYFTILAGLLLLLTACGGSASVSSTSATPTVNTLATATETALIPLMTLVGKPTAKLVAGTTFEVNGQIKNGDSNQHDIYLQATLLDASGAKIASTDPLNIDNVPGGATELYSVQGTTPQPTWASVQITVVKVTENVGSAGTD